MPITVEQLQNQLAALGCQLHVQSTVDSTHAWALRTHIEDGNSAAFIAQEQTAGRGRRGKTWCSPHSGNLYLSVARHFPRDTALSGLSLVTGLSVIAALHGLGAPHLDLKWPNDVLHMNCKIGGILIESQTHNPQTTRVVVGIGINIRMPEDSPIDQAWTDLTRLMPDNCPDALSVAGPLITNLLEDMQTFAASGLKPFAQRWSAHDVLMNQPVAVQGETLIHGIARGIDHDGALRVDTPTGQIRCVSGEVSIRAR